MATLMDKILAERALELSPKIKATEEERVALIQSVADIAVSLAGKTAEPKEAKSQLAAIDRELSERRTMVFSAETISFSKASEPPPARADD